MTSQTVGLQDRKDVTAEADFVSRTVPDNVPRGVRAAESVPHASNAVPSNIAPQRRQAPQRRTLKRDTVETWHTIAGSKRYGLVPQSRTLAGCFMTWDSERIGCSGTRW